jgi:anti-sigma28 factor (negative regulator of flagellin synthesis)
MKGQAAEGRPPTMTEERTMNLDQIKARIERNEYDVDARAVADAIVAKLLGARQSGCS